MKLTDVCTKFSNAIQWISFHSCGNAKLILQYYRFHLLILHSSAIISMK